ncbi:YraN family protein [Candidatus Peregrinibacteria bacterium]|nr:YraN family protein [Candidatus Peregrinibacteria bacterium]
MDKIEKGQKGEDWAARFLEQNGYRILARNYRKRQGEIDIIANDPSTGETVFVEVKMRKGKNFGYPEEAVTPAKIRKLASTALHYLMEKQKEDTLWRIDIIAIEMEDETPEIKHLKNVTQNQL